MDIAGEIPVFQFCRQMEARAKEAGVILCPGAGFDIVYFTALPLILALLVRVTSAMKGLLTGPLAQRWLMRLAEKFFGGGPGDEERAK